MQTKPLGKSDLIAHFENVLELLKNDSCPEGTISWSKTSLGTYGTIAFINYVKPNGEESAVVIGDVSG